MGHLEEHRGDHRAWRIHQATTGVGWVPRCNASLWRLVDMEGSAHNALMKGVSGDIVVGCCGTRGKREAVRTIRRTLLKGAMCETVCRCSGRCKCKAPAPKFQWMRQAEMAEYWKYMVPKLTAAGVVDLSCCLSYEQFWQRCGECRVKVLREGGGDRHDSTGTPCDESGAECATAREGGNEGATCWPT